MQQFVQKIVEQIVQHITQQRKMQSQMADQRGAQFGAQVSKRFPPAWSIGWSDLHLPWHGILLNFGTTLRQLWDYNRINLIQLWENFGIILSHRAWSIGWPNLYLPWHHVLLRSPPQADRWANAGRLYNNIFFQSRDQENNTKFHINCSQLHGEGEMRGLLNTNWPVIENNDGPWQVHSAK